MASADILPSQPLYSDLHRFQYAYQNISKAIVSANKRNKRKFDERSRCVRNLRKCYAKELQVIPDIMYEPMQMYSSTLEMNDRVDGYRRDSIMTNLYYLHKSYLRFKSRTYVKAANIVDIFMVRVRVKPKYMACVAAAAYSLAVYSIEFNQNIYITLAEIHRSNFELANKLIEIDNELISITRCGGSLEDLHRMRQIILSKLALPSMEIISSLDYLDCLIPLCESRGIMFCDHTKDVLYNTLEYSNVSFMVHKYQPIVMAMAAIKCAFQEEIIRNNGEGVVDFDGVASDLVELVESIVETSNLDDCINFVKDIDCSLRPNKIDVLNRYKEPNENRPMSHRNLVWEVSRRTRSLMMVTKGFKQPSFLHDITEEKINDTKDVKTKKIEQKWCNENSDKENIENILFPTIRRRRYGKPVCVSEIVNQPAAIHYLAEK